MKIFSYIAVNNNKINSQVFGKKIFKYIEGKYSGKWPGKYSVICKKIFRYVARRYQVQYIYSKKIFVLAIRFYSANKTNIIM